jgi:hypothetical protein
MAFAAAQPRCAENNIDIVAGSDDAGAVQTAIGDRGHKDASSLSRPKPTALLFAVTFVAAMREEKTPANLLY